MASRVYIPHSDAETATQGSEYTEGDDSYTLNTNPEDRDGFTTDDEEEVPYDDETTVSGLSVPTTGPNPEEVETTLEEHEDTRVARPFLETTATLTKDQIIARNTNLHLKELLEQKQWEEAMALILNSSDSNTKAADFVSLPFPKCGGDFPLHVVCDWDYEPGNTNNEDGNSLYSSRIHNSANVDDTKSVGTAITGRTRTPTNKPNLLTKPPPLELIEAILNAYPKAARTRGRDGSLPLHYAARGCAPPHILKLLIKAFPQALDVADEFNETPRAFYQKTADNIAILDRPICCWEHHFHDVEDRDAVEESIAELWEEVARLELELGAEKEYKKRMANTLKEFLLKASEFSNGEEESIHGKHVEYKATALENVMSSELNSLSTRLDAIAVRLKKKYEANDEERKYIRLFDEDVVCIYQEAALTTSALQQDHRTLKKIFGIDEEIVGFSNPTTAE